MGDTSHLLPAHGTHGTLSPATPSGLTPNTRSEAEAALSQNATTQTESAAPTSPLPPQSAVDENAYPSMNRSSHDSTLDEATKAYRRPAGVLRTSSTNYMEALSKAHAQSSVSSTLSTDTVPGKETNAGATTSPTSTSTSTFPPPGQGVVALHPGIGSGQAEAVKRARPTGLSLGNLGRMPSWSEQDMKHVYSSQLMGEVKGDAGYASGNEGPK